MAQQTKALTLAQKAETIRALLDNQAVRRQVQMAIPKHLTVDRLLRVVMTAVRTNPKLMDCTQKSLLACIMGCAQLGLETDNYLGQAYLVPFKNNGIMEATLIIGYRGYIALARRSGEVQSVSAQVVYEKDFFNLRYGTTEALEHIPADGDRGNPKGAYVVFKYKDGSHSFDYMSVEDVEKIRARSKQPDGTAWKDSWDEMAKKTVIRRHVKLAPLAVEIQKAAYLEDRAMSGESQFDALLTPEAEEAVIESEPVKTWDECLIGRTYDEAALNQFLAETARGNKTTVAKVKEEAPGDFESFWSMFEAWQKIESAKAKKGEQKGPEQTEGKTIDCPDAGVISATTCQTCPRRQGCPAHEKGEK